MASSRRNQALAQFTQMCADVLSIVDSYEWKPFKGIEIKFVSSGQRRGHLIEDTEGFNGGRILLEKIPINVATLSRPDLLSATKRRKLMYYLIDMKDKSLSRATGREVTARMTRFMTELVAEYPCSNSFQLRPRNCKELTISSELLKAVCDWITETIQLTHPLFRLN